jgi:hypothetical protein
MAGHVCFGLLRIKKGAGLLPNAWVKIVIPARHRAGRHVFSPARKSVFSHFKKLPNLLTSTYDAGFGLFNFFHLFPFIFVRSWRARYTHAAAQKPTDFYRLRDLRVGLLDCEFMASW